MHATALWTCVFGAMLLAGVNADNRQLIQALQYPGQYEVSQTGDHTANGADNIFPLKVTVNLVAPLDACRSAFDAYLECREGCKAKRLPLKQTNSLPISCNEACKVDLRSACSAAPTALAAQAVTVLAVGLAALASHPLLGL